MTLWPNGSATQPRVSSPYGPRDPRVGLSSFHHGVDFIGYTTIRAVLPGRVSWAGRYNDAAGNAVCVRPDGFNDTVEILDFHIASWKVSKGQRVSEGQALAVPGMTGNASGVCDHFEIRVNGTAVDPIAWMRAHGVGAAPAGSVSGASAWTDAEKQTFLVSIGLDTGGIGNGWGAKSIAATKTFQQLVGLTDDGVFGPNTTGVAQVIKAGANLTARPTADIQRVVGAAADGIWGNKTSLALFRWQKANNLTADAKYGPLSDAKAFPPAPPVVVPPSTQWPTNGRNATSRPTAEIQRLVGVKDDGDYGPATSQAVAAWQAAHWLEADGVWGPTSDGTGFPPAGSTHGIDYSFARPDAATLAQRGVKLAGRYLWAPTYQDGRTNKGISPAELAALNAAGIEVFFIYEEDGKELLGGRAAGVRVASAAEGFLATIGKQGCPVYFNVDYDAPAADLPKILDALDGIASVIGIERVGLYAGYGPLTAAFDAGKIRWGFQTYAWSGGKWDARAQLQQWSNGQWGGSVDFTRAMVAEYGQHPVAVTPPDPEPELTEIPTSLAKQLWEWLKGKFGAGA